MIWKKYTIDTTTAATDFISQALSEEGVEGIEIVDNVPLTSDDIQEMFVDILPEIPEDDGTAKIHFYLDGDMTEEALANKIDDIKVALEGVASFVDAGPLTITEGETNDEDWRNNWKKYFHPFMVDDVLIKPTWEQMPEDSNHSLMIEIDPGAAFGTGSHETTKLCIRNIRKFIKDGDRILDVGTGSGILAILALKSGASYALGTDLDPFAITAARENADVNEIPEKDFDIIAGNIIDDDEIKKECGDGYDMVLANILAPAIIALQEEVPAHIKDGGIFIVSGIINTKEAEVKEAFAKNCAWEYVDTTYEDEWVSIVYRKVKA